MSPSKQAQTPGNKDDADLFLTSVETKLRGPFSSLDLAKAVTSTNLRGSLTPAEYLDMISQVLSRTDKVIQLRMLVAMLGLDPSEETNARIYKVLQQAQEAPLHEEWVRTISGLIQGSMFYSKQEGDDGNSKEAIKEDPRDSRVSCRGEEAKKMLDKTCKEIIARVAKEIKKCNRQREESIAAKRREEDQEADQEEDGEFAVSANPHRKDDQHDMNPFFAPFRYAWLSPSDVSKLIPECDENPHFIVNRDVGILKIDDKLDLERTKEELSHKTMTLGSIVSQKAAPGKSSTTEVDFPGFRKSKPSALAKAPKKSSMFMPTKKPIPSKSAGMKGTHVRKAGAAQALLAKNRMKQRMAGKIGLSSGPGGAGTSRALGKSKGLAIASGRSRMMMIDANEVSLLNKEHKNRDDKATLAEKRNSRKRQIHEMAAKKGILGNKAKRIKESGRKVGTMKRSVKPLSEPDPDPEHNPESDSEPAQEPELDEPPAPAPLPFPRHHDDDDDDSDDEERDFGFGAPDEPAVKKKKTPPAPVPVPVPTAEKPPPQKVEAANGTSGGQNLDQYGLDTNTLMALQKQREQHQQQEQIRLQQQQDMQMQLIEHERQQHQLQLQREQELHYQMQLQERALQERQIREQLLVQQQAAAELQLYQQQQRLQQQKREQELHQFQQLQQQQQQQQLLAQQLVQQQAQQQQQQQRRSAATNDSWRMLLHERSNKLSPEDRTRVQQFFERQYNPTPKVPIYKMKLHEERGVDPATQQAIKETYYLELDYRSFTSKQSKKVKKY